MKNLIYVFAVVLMGLVACGAPAEKATDSAAVEVTDSAAVAVVTEEVADSAAVEVVTEEVEAESAE